MEPTRPGDLVKVKSATTQWVNVKTDKAEG